MAHTARPLEEAPLPTILRWQEPHNPLPVRAVRLPARARPRTLGLESPPWLKTGLADRSFDFCGHVRALCADVVRRCPELGHIDVSRLLFGMSHGTLAGKACHLIAR